MIKHATYPATAVKRSLASQGCDKKDKRWIYIVY
jgi:hypothetical protein